MGVVFGPSLISLGLDLELSLAISSFFFFLPSFLPSFLPFLSFYFHDRGFPGMLVAVQRLAIQCGRWVKLHWLW